MRIEPGRSLVLGAVPPEGGPPLMTWAFVLEERQPGVTRLIARARERRGYQPPFGLPHWTVRTLVPWGHLIMQRKQLLGIARRAEEAAAATTKAAAPRSASSPRPSWKESTGGTGWTG